MLNFTDVTLRRGPRVLLEKLNWTVYAGQRVGITGRNGTGKSSLFAMIQGEISADVGDVSLPANISISHVRQDTPALAQSALDYVLDGDVPWRKLSWDLEQAEVSGDADALGRLHENMHAIDGYTAPARAGQLLHGLGFAARDEQRPVSDFSGGWRMRLNLAQALMCRSDLLLLDEPTNHLDLDAVVWLQDHLAAYRGTLLMISHDRDFLDAVCSHILHLERQAATLFTGNYSSSESQRAAQLLQQAAQYKAQQRKAAQLQSFVDRFRAKATKARQAQSRVKQLEKMQLVAPAHWADPFSFEFAEPQRLPAPLLRFDDVNVGYGETAVLTGVNLSLAPGDRVALLGRNGAGKSTLMRSIAGTQPTLAGGREHRDRALKVGYFAQHQVDSLDAGSSAVAHLESLDRARGVELAREQVLRDFLGGFDFHGDRVFEPVGPFSGGEKARLALALLVWQQPNLLLLDEPSNHLDLDMRHALELALQGFSGAVVVVSHDRHLLASCADQLLMVADGRCTEFAGDLDDYANLLRQRLKADTGASETLAKQPRQSQKDARRSAAQARAEQKPLRDKIRAAEKSMHNLETKLAKLEQALADPALYVERPEQAAELAREQGLLQKQLEEAEQSWLEASESLELLQTSAG